MSDSKHDLQSGQRSQEIHAFLEQVARAPVSANAGRGRLIFAIDATASREPTWDQASHLQAEMFDAAAGLGGLQIQLAYYRGHREFHAGDWLADAPALLQQMTAVSCRGGLTQLERVLRHGAVESARSPVNALVFVGDCIEENPERLYRSAGELGLRGTPAFMFLEGHDRRAQRCFAEIARITRGAFGRFDSGSARQLRELLTAVAVYASGGKTALRQLAASSSSNLRQLAHQLEGR